MNRMYEALHNKYKNVKRPNANIQVPISSIFDGDSRKTVSLIVYGKEKDIDKNIDIISMYLDSITTSVIIIDFSNWMENTPLADARKGTTIFVDQVVETCGSWQNALNLLYSCSVCLDNVMLVVKGLHHVDEDIRKLIVDGIKEVVEDGHMKYKRDKNSAPSVVIVIPHSIANTIDVPINDIVEIEEEYDF